MDLSTELFAAVGAILGAIGAILSHLILWFKGRDQDSKNRKKLECAKLEVDFLSSWLAATADLSGAAVEKKKTSAKERLVRLLDDSEFTSKTESDLQQKPKAGILVNIVFYGYFGFYLIMLLGASVDESNDLSFSTLLTEENLILLFFLVVPLFVIYYFRHRSIQKRLSRD